jgi:hypothetical protein
MGNVFGTDDANDADLDFCCRGRKLCTQIPTAQHPSEVKLARQVPMLLTWSYHSQSLMIQDFLDILDFLRYPDIFLSCIKMGADNKNKLLCLCQQICGLIPVLPESIPCNQPVALTQMPY